ncbi:helix-hairpin-helix domain-containing protein [Pedobacter sp. Du54]|uniref:ComEA family DNA-binding protein n=1 Tax=Pedobacter anseongensis TaxID=3133439 RepID=UPI0030A0F5BB
MKKWLNNYFSLTKCEYNGLLALFGLLVFAFVTPYIYDALFKKEESITDFERNAIQELNLIALNEQPPSKFHKREKEVFSKPILFKFDPNQILLEDWKKLGLSIKQAQSIINFRNKGGKFYKVEDLKKMYTISPKLFEKLQPYVEIVNPLGEKKKKFEVKAYTKKEYPVIEINSADTLALDKIKGIGAAFARRITNYRNKLGGFYKKEQLMEVYGLDSVKYKELKDQIQVDVSAIKKININTADFESLKNHPYLKYKQINTIIEYRKQHGNYSSIADLKKLLILSTQTIDQLTPYLQF